MESKDVGIEDWPAIAKSTGYRVDAFREYLGKSRRWLDTVCWEAFAKSPHAVLAAMRAAEIKELAATKKSAKEIYQEVGFSHLACLSRAMKRDAGHGLRNKADQKS